MIVDDEADGSQEGEDGLARFAGNATSASEECEREW